MGNLTELTAFKEELLRLIVSDEMLIRAVAHPTANCLSIPVDKPGSLLYQNIFPFRWTLDETQTDKSTFVTMDFSNFGLVHGYYKDFSMALYVLTHKDLARIRDVNNTKNILRVDFILERIDTLLNNARGFGIGKLTFGGLGSVHVNDKILGSYIMYHTVSFNDTIKPDEGLEDV